MSISNELAKAAQYLTVNTSSNVITSNATLNAVSYTTGDTGTGTGGISANVTTLWVGNNTINTTITSAGLTVNGTAVVANSTGVWTTGTINAASHTTGATGTGTGGISANVTTLWVGNNTINTKITSAGLTVNGTAVVANSSGVYTTGVVNTSAITGLSNTLSLVGNSSTLATLLLNAAETTNVSATAANSTMTYYLASQSVMYLTTNAAANWNPNVAFSSGTTLNTALSTGQAITFAMLVSQGTTAYYSNTIYIDGSAVTPKWQGGTAPTAGNASGIDGYTYTIIKTGSAAFTVLASQTQFK